MKQTVSIPSPHPAMCIREHLSFLKEGSIPSRQTHAKKTLYSRQYIWEIDEWRSDVYEAIRA